ncbi:PREDICTED: O-acetyl-ADP-ribose deacetylase 1-like, partial [Corvus brachyrhynchos]|uniref:O-acetyl-ADP-ribose deacetylase 1-like n=1 Tax=Corvus brachyrhynchos TaxID=85066 RepID=UPI0008164807
MGAGIAVLFKKKFGGVQELLDQKKKTGEVAVLRRDDRYIYYLVRAGVALGQLPGAKLHHIPGINSCGGFGHIHGVMESQNALG